jgi:hypothetical protein
MSKVNEFINAAKFTRSEKSEGGNQITDKEIKSLGDMMKKMTLSESAQATDYLRKNDPELRSFVRAEQNDLLLQK